MSMSVRSSLVGAGSVAAPVAIFLFLKVTIGLGPAQSPAQSPSPAPGPTPTLTGALPARTLEQTRAIEWLASVKVDADLPSPLEHTDAPVLPKPTPPPPQTPPDPLADLRLSVLLSGVGGGSAMISGKVYRPGEVVIEGYTLKSIDVRGQRVELTGPDGQGRWIERKP